jgi:iron complex outermembrane recepter protein
MKNRFYAGVALIALSVPGVAFAQSTGSVEFEKDIVVTASKNEGIGGTQIPDSSKAKGVLTQEFIAHQTPGNSILNTINNLPGVNFQNNDPFGSAGGTLNIRGFDSSRIALTFDGVPLNDSGSYAVFSNQQLDPELIDNVNVNYGSTDVDSPSAGATGSTVNYRTRNPSDKFGARLLGSGGDFKFMRIFGAVDTGVFTPWGTKAFFAASTATNNWFVNDFGKINKQQYNGKIYQPIGDNGDFISIAGHYNQNRNNFGGSAPLRTDTNVFTSAIVGGVPTLVTGALKTVGTGTGNRFPVNIDEIPYHVARCQTTAGVAGVADAASTCGTTFDERYNPSNTGNIRINSKFTLAQGLVLTVDPSFQYVKANGGGTVSAREFLRDINPASTTGANVPGTPNVSNCTTVTTGTGVSCTAGYFAGAPYVGRDLNGDGDLLDQVTLLAPSQTQTKRFGVLASLRYQIAEGQSVRLTYSYDRARHRQTGEIGLVQINGVPADVFPVNAGLTGSNSQRLEKRDRLSYAILNQISGEYRGEFFDRKLTATIGIRAPFYKRDLTNYCFGSNATGNVECFGRDSALQTQLTGYFPYSVNATTGVPVPGSWSVPQNRVFKYNKILPNVGFVFKPVEHWSIFANYSKGIQVPGTDNLYNSFFFPVGSAQANPVPETTANFDGGVRYTSSRVQASISPWFTRFTNRLASAFDPDTQQTVYRNLGTVDKYGIDGNLSFKPIDHIVVNLFGSYLKSKIQKNVQLGNCPATLTAANTTVNCTVAAAPIFALTAGKRESAASVYSYGARIEGEFGPLEVGFQAKRYGKRYLNDQNLPVIGCTVALVNTICPTVANTPTTYTGTRGIEYVAYQATARGYTTVDMDARLKLGWAGLNDKTYFQLNVQNLFNKYYVGGFSGGSTLVTSIPFAQIGLPRTFIGTLNVAF